MFGLLVVGGGIAGTQAVLRTFLFDIEIKNEGGVLAAPRILVNEGQTAQMTMTHADGTVHIVNIDEAGNVTYRGDDAGVELDVAVSEPGTATELMNEQAAEAEEAVQLLYAIELKRGDEVLSSPRVMVLAGQKAVVTISDESGVEHVTTIHEDGTVSYEGADDVTLAFRIEEISAGGGDDH